GVCQGAVDEHVDLRLQAGDVQDERGVGAGGDDGAGQVVGAGRLQVAGRARVHRDALVPHELQDPLVLAVPDAVERHPLGAVGGLPARQGDVPAAEEVAHPVDAALAVDVGGVVGDRVEGDEGL